MAMKHLSAVATVGDPSPSLDQAAAALRGFSIEKGRPFADFGNTEGTEQFLRSIRGMTKVLEYGFGEDGAVADINPHIISAALEGIYVLAAMASASIAAQEAMTDAAG